jgi:acetate kinase
MQPAIAHRPESRVAVLVVPTDEELMIAQHTLAFPPKHAAKSGMLLGMQQQ